MSAAQELQERFEQMKRDGLVAFHGTAGPAWVGLTDEQKAKALLDWFDAPKLPLASA